MSEASPSRSAKKLRYRVPPAMVQGASDLVGSSKGVVGKSMMTLGTMDHCSGQSMPGTKWVVRGKLGQGGNCIVLDIAKEQLIMGAMKVLLPPLAKQPEFAAKFFGRGQGHRAPSAPQPRAGPRLDRFLDGTPFMVVERLQVGRSERRFARRARAARFGLQRIPTRWRRRHPRAFTRTSLRSCTWTSNPRTSYVVKAMTSASPRSSEKAIGRTSARRATWRPSRWREGGSPQTDQYALALVNYEMVTGRLPWDVNVCDSKGPSQEPRRWDPGSAGSVARPDREVLRQPR